MNSFSSDQPSRYKPGTVLGPDALSPGELGKIRALLALSAQKGVLVGIQAGHAAWDMRPLLLERGVTSIVRFSNPALAESGAASDRAKEYLRRFVKMSDRIGVMGHGQTDGRIWIRRAYYKEVFTTEPGWARFASVEARLAVIRKLVGLLNDMKTLGLVHGHVCSSNLTMLPGGKGELEPRLMDFGALIFDPNLAAFWERDPGRYGVEVAPEILEGSEPNDASDIFGLGLLLKIFHQTQAFHTADGADSRNFIFSMLSNKPSDRPDLLEVVRTFAPRGLLPEEMGGSPQAVDFSGLRAGRIIARTPEQKMPPVEARPHIEEVASPVVNGQQPKENAVESGKMQDSLSSAKVLFQEYEARKDDGSVNPAVESNLRLMRILLMLALVVVAGFMLMHSLPHEAPVSEDFSEAEYLADWSSGQPSRMGSVAEAALERPGSKARSVIVKSAFSGVQVPGLRAGLLQVAMDPQWEKTLQESDRRLALALSLQELLPTFPGRLPELSQAHAGVKLAIAGSVSLDKVPPSFSAISIEEITKLPGPVGEAYRVLYRQGIKSLGERTAIALARIVSGDASQEVVRDYFSVPEGQDKQQEDRLVVLIPFVTRSSDLAGQTYNLLQKSGGNIRRLLGWFDEESIVPWKDVSRAQILSLLPGATSGRDLQLEHLVDLLKFPLLSVRSMAQRRLLEGFVSEGLFSTIAFLASPQNRFSRFQTISLVFALKGREGTGEAALISAWFKGAPDSRSVLSLLLARKDVEKDDLFNLEAARYLAAVDFDVTLEQLKELASHPETLARALAISRLDTSKPEEASILKDMAVVEPNERIRTQIREKILAQ